MQEVLQAGNRAAKQLKEGTDMVAAIRARLARKSLPMVSADGLVVYGLQISPTMQIATGKLIVFLSYLNVEETNHSGSLVRALIDNSEELWS